MNIYTLYDQNGLIVSRVSGSLLAEDLHSGLSAFTGHYDSDTHYFLEGYPEPRPAFALQPNTTTLTPLQTFRVDNIPAGTLVTYPDGEVVVDDGYIEWTSAVEGEFTFTFQNFPYIEESINAQFSYL